MAPTSPYGVLAHRILGYGHSIGILCHHFGREAGLELREDIETVLSPGMAVSIEPIIMIPEGMPGVGGYREHDILAVTENGSEDITGFPCGPNTTSFTDEREILSPVAGTHLALTKWTANSR